MFAGCLLAKSHGKGAESLRNLKSDRLHVVQLDVTSQAQLEAAVKEVKKLLPKEGEHGKRGKEEIKIGMKESRKKVWKEGGGKREGRRERRKEAIHRIGTAIRNSSDLL